MSSQTPIFIISSGRTGSTLLAKMLNRHPEILIVSDLFEPVGDEPYFHPGWRVSGGEFWKIISRPSFPQRIKSWRRKPNAELLFLPDDDNLVSLLLSYTIPFISDEPIKFFYELEKEVSTFPEDNMPGQMIRLFNHLRDKIGKPLWVERTGGSLPHAEKIMKLWPEAKIVHNIRDPRETAISMMKGSFFRLYLELEKNPQMGEWDESYFPPLEEMGAMLNRWFVASEKAFNAFAPDRMHILRYEDLMQDAEKTLLELIPYFLERQPHAADHQWAKAEAEIIRPSSLKFSALDHTQQAALTAAVQESLDILSY